MMNMFRLAGDMSHVISILVLILRLRVSKNAVGISIKTQELYLLVFVSRYLDLFTTFYSLYNSVMKCSYIAATAYIIYMVRYTEPFKTNYEKAHDSFLHWQFAVLPCVAIGIVTNVIQGFNIMELFWIFSIYLEALSIVPQLIVLQRYREVENLTGHYVFFLGAYRFLYILNWVYRSIYEPYYKHNWIVYGCGVVQTCLYLDFFYYFILSKYRGGKFSLPN
mmetsp:Transcript_11549/g.11565  ORF Transcript_11549/g.11565 Transcript_11549/m.11565 type:complete len:221 (-) Transcript_11549:136-798(-)